MNTDKDKNGDIVELSQSNTTEDSLSSTIPKKGFLEEIVEVINRYSMENGSNTPDFILGEYLFECLLAYNKASRKRERWYGKQLTIGGIKTFDRDKLEYLK